MEPIKRNLRKAIRVIDFAHHTAHSEPIFKRLKIFNFDKLYTLETAKIMFEINKDPEKFPIKHEFIKTKDLHRYNTRQSSSEGFSLPLISTKLKKAFLTFDGVKIWNSLPDQLKKIKNKNSFVKSMKFALANNS